MLNTSFRLFFKIWKLETLYWYMYKHTAKNEKFAERTRFTIAVYKKI